MAKYPIFASSGLQSHPADRIPSNLPIRRMGHWLSHTFHFSWFFRDLLDSNNRRILSNHLSIFWNSWIRRQFFQLIVHFGQPYRLSHNCSLCMHQNMVIFYVFFWYFETAFSAISDRCVCNANVWFRIFRLLLQLAIEQKRKDLFFYPQCDMPHLKIGDYRCDCIVIAFSFEFSS